MNRPTLTTTEPTREEIEALAGAFTGVLAEWLGSLALQEIDAKNAEHKEAGNLGVCASHDYCDANMAMDAAFKRLHGEARPAFALTGDEEDVPEERKALAAHDLKLWNAAWDHAKAEGFVSLDPTPEAG